LALQWLGKADEDMIMADVLLSAPTAAKWGRVLPRPTGGGEGAQGRPGAARQGRAPHAFAPAPACDPWGGEREPRSGRPRAALPGPLPGATPRRSRNPALLRPGGSLMPRDRSWLSPAGASRPSSEIRIAQPGARSVIHRRKVAASACSCDGASPRTNSRKAMRGRSAASRRASGQSSAPSTSGRRV
jgi:hypothetical protein